MGNQLPLKWTIKRDELNASTINKWMNENTGGDFYKCSEGYINYPNSHDGKGFKRGSHFSSGVEPGYTEITFEQFLEFIGQPKGKITGYKIIKKWPGMKSSVGDIMDVDPTFDNSVWNEFFEPVYEDVYKEGDWLYYTENYNDYWYKGKVFKFGGFINKDQTDEMIKEIGNLNGRCYTKYNSIRRATQQEIINHHTVSIAGYTMVITNKIVSFGCKSFTKDEIKFLQRLICNDGFTIHIDNEEITNGVINKIISIYENITNK